MVNELFNKKSVDRLVEEASAENGHGLDRSLGLFNLIALGIGILIGAGIFVLTGQAAANHAGPGVVISFMMAAVGCAFSALCYAEFATMIPIAGSAYTYAYATLGEVVAWIVGWDLILGYIFCSSTVAVGWSGYLVSLLKDVGIVIPPEFCNPPLNLPAMFIVVLMTVLLTVGIRKTAKFNNAIVIIKITVILLFIFLGFAHINNLNLTPFIPPNTGEFGSFGWSGILRGTGVVFFAYTGFDAVASAAQEARNPQRDMPIAIMSSLLICTILYVGVSLVLTGIVPYQQLNVPDPIAVGVNAIKEELPWLPPTIKIGAIAGLSSVILVSQLGQSRVLYAIAKDGLLPPLLAAVHPQFRTPHIATIISGIFAALCAGLLPIDLLGELSSMAVLFAFLIVSLAVPILRRSQPDLPRPFKTPLVPLVPILGVITSGLQMVALSTDTWLRLLAWMAIGLVLYFTYGRKNSTLNHQKEQPTEYPEMT
ncbi:amino acid permease [Planktothrix sp. FACHB-1355]|uniref:Amino acid permease n=1 Tax=Aerosakkonema funiforme FACHB-1375 TaxID=2949571 RepID=A0A926VI94_9CYAN|nr:MULTISPECIES: amino acid permease [Oscillatoriales]MBD2184273.1 amino acid permease [Aerosakkonema funiforme FACHB-1375]MBD3562556.1 amino acid permease [Planktothrix sp. FACHB-1355]